MKRFVILSLVVVLLLGTVIATYAGLDGFDWVSLYVSMPTDDCAVTAAYPDGTFYHMKGTYKVTQADNPEGNLLFTCRGELQESYGGMDALPAPGKAFRVNSDRDYSFFCFDGVNAVPSLNWWFQVTPSGNAVYKCHVNPSH